MKRPSLDLVVLILVLAGGLLGQARGEAPAAPAAPPLPADLDLVPRNVFAFIALRPADLSSSLLDPKLVKKLTNHPLAMQMMVILNARNLGGLELADLERAIVVMDHFDPMNVEGQFGAAAVVTARKALDPKKVLDGLLPGAKKQQAGDKNYFVQGGNAFAFLGERSFCFGDEKTVAKWLKLGDAERKQGPLAGALKLAVDQDIVVALNPQPLAQFVPLAALQVPPEYQPLLHLIKSRTSVVSLSVRDELEIDLFVTLADRDAREAAAKDARTGMTRLADLLAGARKPVVEAGFPRTEKLMAATEAALKKAPVRRENLRLHIPLYLEMDKASLQSLIEEWTVKALDGR